MKSKLIIPTFLLLLQASVFGQSFSLKDCINYAEQKNSSIKISNLNADLSSQKVNEQIGTALPQIDFSSTLEDKLKLSTTIMPGELVGKPGTTLALQTGTKYNLSAGVTLDQKIFAPSFWVGLKAAKISEEMSQLTQQKTTEQVLYSVGTAYYKVVILQKKLENLQKILEASHATLTSTQLKFANGIGKKIDVDKVQVSYNNTYSELQQTRLTYKEALNNLKYEMGMPVKDELKLTDSLDEVISVSGVAATDDYNSYLDLRTDYKLQKSNISLYEAERENNMSAYLPTLSFYAKYNYEAMRNQFNLFNKGQEWYNNSAIGLELKIPIFSGFSRYAKVEQSSLNVEIEKENLRQNEQSIYVDISNKTHEYNNAISNIQIEKDNMNLAESVYTNTQIEFSQGASSSLDLTDAERSLVEAQNNYYTQLQSLYIARLDLEKAQGTLNNFIHNIK
jgi:outer membrane protein TolC